MDLPSERWAIVHLKSTVKVHNRPTSDQFSSSFELSSVHLGMHTKPIADTTTIAGLSLPPGTHMDLDPLGGGHCVLLAVTGADGVMVEVRLYVPERERGDWRRAVRMMRGEGLEATTESPPRVV